MAISRIGALLVIGAGLLGAIAPAWAQSPGLYYAWRSVESDLTTCLDRSTAALTNGGLTDIQVEGNSVAGTTENSTAVFVCLENSEPTMVMIMVSSMDDDAAFELRETLKASF
ncbi:hypothetical protein [Halomicronema sp. CCY15110]|uniref:hypothetical protein n=1 Tax=Halomicronema sp. CCY15110 TaxID=2767773 RepID=UPI00194F4647|nr:hypothetical protein [Halomicronema sp. CCY15110]